MSEYMCPKCGSKKTHDTNATQNVIKAGRVIGEISSIAIKVPTGFFGPAIGNAAQKALGAIGGGLGNAIWCFRVCENCGHKWNYLF
ncbi:MAG: hypothetical protein HDS81_03100 [Bacteroidales bacterium]|nr:hypothetical protein [Bacteroidales bacterium]